MHLSNSPDSNALLLSNLTAEKNRRLTENRLAYYKPYPKQVEFHKAGAAHRERLFLCGNQLGKTLAGAFECAMHASGRYPDWWTGKRFDRPIVGWVAGVTGETVRDTVQKLLIGRPGQEGVGGAIPKDAIAELVSARGTPDLLDTIRVHHVSGGVSIIGLKTYASGREKFQGETLDFAWLDEECPSDVYTEVLTRTNVGNGPVWMTMTPLLGVSEVVRRFLHEKSPDRKVITMTISDVGHYSDEEKKTIEASYPPHEREARLKGIPVLGSGRVFPVPEETLAIDHREFPPHWPRIGGMDFGWDHPFAAVELAWDRDSDVIYVSKTYRVKETTPIVHAAALRAWGKELRWAWPRDGNRETLEGAGIALAAQYRAQGLNLLHEFSHYLESNGQKSVSVEAGLMDMLDRMQSGRFKVFREHNDWWEEFRLYHRKDGKVVKEGDDLMAATRYAIMALRHASTVASYKSFRRKLNYQKLGLV
jgi:phage terminase large subunit-like protein